MASQAKKSAVTRKTRKSFLEDSRKLDLKSSDLFGDKYNTEILPAKYFVQLYGEFFHTYSFHTKIQTEDFLRLLNRKYGLKEENYVYKYLDAEDVDLNTVDYSSSEFLIHVKEKVMLYIGHENFKIWYARDIDFSEVLKITDIVEACREKISFNRKFFMVVATQDSEYGFELQQFDLNKIDIDLESNYNEDFLPVHEIITGFLKQEDQNGLVLLHGKFGTGKTTYLRHLISTINKRVIFLPLELIDTISSPGFLPFIAQYKDSVLILEDCEELLRPRDVSSYKQGGIQNLLNLGDGLLADALSIKIICTFNAELKLIDKAILRKGRLVARYEFNELDLQKAKDLALKLGVKEEITEPMTLAELFNLERQDFSFSKVAEMRKVGY
jgi:DNA replication protein DnaC